MDIISFFDPYNLEHMKAYEHLCKTGIWPKDFLPNDIVFSNSWSMILASKLADAWMKYILSR